MLDSPAALMLDSPAASPRVPLTCFWEITNACNLRCIHCELDAGERAADELSTEEALALCDDLADAGCHTVHLTGGEPLGRADWPVIARRLADRGLSSVVITNGLLVGEAVLRRMIDAGVTGVSVSLDGTREVHDWIRRPAGRSDKSSYDAAIRAIELVTASQLKTAVITQVHKRNIGDLERMYRQIVSLGVDVWQLQLAMPLGRLLEVRCEYLVEPKQLATLTGQLAGFIRDKGVSIAVGDNIGYFDRHEPVLRGSLRGLGSFWSGCLAGCRVVAICSNGDVKGCPSHPPSFAAGNIRQTPFGEIWADPKRFAYNTEWKQELLEGGCAKCPYGRICRAGCKSMSFAATGTIYDNPFCVQHAAMTGGER